MSLLYNSVDQTQPGCPIRYGQRFAITTADGNVNKFSPSMILYIYSTNIIILFDSTISTVI